MMRLLTATLAISCLVHHSIDAIPVASPIQNLPEKPGFVPVYIRYGNTPLDQVNPKLVEAFREENQETPVIIELTGDDDKTSSDTKESKESVESKESKQSSESISSEKNKKSSESSESSEEKLQKRKSRRQRRSANTSEDSSSEESGKGGQAKSPAEKEEGSRQKRAMKDVIIIIVKNKEDGEEHNQ